MKGNLATPPAGGDDGAGEAAKPIEAKKRVEPRKVYLFPGRLVVAAEPCAVTTILGSCVAVCLWNPILRTGGVNHYLLPHRAGSHQASARFGNLAIERLIAEMLALGGHRRDLQAKIFGGAHILAAAPDESTHLGARNVRVARELLQRENIPLVAEDVGGQGGRKLIFHTHDGSVWVRKL